VDWIVAGIAQTLAGPYELASPEMVIDVALPKPPDDGVTVAAVHQPACTASTTINKTT
jgi:hypothetical protein